MGEPVEFLIVQNLQAALRGIATEAGYHHDLAGLAVKLDPEQSVEDLIGDSPLRPFIVIELEPDALSYAPSRMVNVELSMTIHAVHDSDPADDDSWLRTHLRLCADVEQAIAADHSRGGLAVDTRIVSREAARFGGQQVWALVKTGITVRRFYGAPNA